MTDATADHASVATILLMLESRAATDRLFAVAARIIRSQEMAISTLENDIAEAEWRAISHAVEIQRMADHRYALAVAAAKKRAG